MAEEISDSSVTHEKHIVEESATIDADHCKSSIVSPPTGSITGTPPTGGITARNSASKSDSPQNSVPNYLRASTGSCHDLCKYGHKHTFEEKPWKKKPVRKGSVSATNSTNSSLNFIQIKVAGEAKKEMSLESKTCALKDNALSSDKPRFLRNSSLVKKRPSLEPPEIIKSVITSPSQEMEVFEEKRSSTGGKGSKTEEIKDNCSEKHIPAKSKLTKVKPWSSVDAVGNNGKLGVNGGNGSKTDEKMDHSSEKPASGKSKMTKVRPLSSSVDSDGKNGKGVINGGKGSKTDERTDHNSEKRALAKSKLTKVRPSSSSVDSDGKNGKGVIKGGKGSKTDERTDNNSEKRAPANSKLTKVRSPSSSVDSDGKNGKGEINGGEVSKTDGKTDQSSEKRAPAKSKLTKVKPLSSLVDSDGKNGKGEINRQVKSEKKILVPKASAMKPLLPIAPTSSPKIRHTRRLSFEGKKASLKLAPLVKDRINMRTAGTKMTKNEKAAEKTLHLVNVETGPLTKSSSRIKDVEAKENNKKTPRSRLVPSEDKHRSAVKLQFKSGKVVEIRSDNNTPRRLKFRKARVPGGEDIKGEVTKKSSSKAVTSTDVAGADISSRKVALKRQVVQGKKVARVLLNNVIEETASKLVESRKSKVKALVGAFETVISLHESKSSQTVKLGSQ